MAPPGPLFRLVEGQLSRLRILLSLIRLLQLCLPSCTKVQLNHRLAHIHGAAHLQALLAGLLRSPRQNLI